MFMQFFGFRTNHSLKRSRQIIYLSVRIAMSFTPASNSWNRYEDMVFLSASQEQGRRLPYGGI